MMLFLESRAKYNEGEVNIHYKTPIRREEKEFIPEDELRKRQEDQVRGHPYTTYYVKNCIFLPKLLGPTAVRKNCFIDREKTFEIRG